MRAIVASFAALVVLLVLLIAIRHDLAELDARIAKQEARLTTTPVPSASAEERVDEEILDAAKRCRSMGDLPLAAKSIRNGRQKLVCLQGPSIAFEIDSEWPQ